MLTTTTSIGINFQLFGRLHKVLFTQIMIMLKGWLIMISLF